MSKSPTWTDVEGVNLAMIESKATEGAPSVYEVSTTDNTTPNFLLDKRAKSVALAFASLKASYLALLIASDLFYF